MFIIKKTPPDRTSLMGNLYDATEVIDPLDDMTDREEGEPFLEGSEDELGLRLSEDEERLVNTT